MAAPTSEIGNAGVVTPHRTTLGGLGASYYQAKTPEDVAALQWPLVVHTYDRVRRDSKVASSLRAMVQPIMGADWRINPDGARPEVVQAIADDLGLPILGDDARRPHRMRDRFDWGYHLRHALLSRVYGFMPFEQVYRLADDGRFRLRKLAVRMPHTLTLDGIKVASDGGVEGIWQEPVGFGRPVFIPESSLVMYVHEREGADWYGQSILRAVYRDWVLKDHYHRIASIAVDRNGAGVPIYTDADPEKIGAANVAAEAAAGQKLAESYRAGESAGGRVPHSADFELLGVSGSTVDILAYIRYHDEQIAGSMLEMFSSLPSAPNGSRALGTSLVDFFVRSLNAHSADIAKVTTQHVVEDWVDINYGPDAEAPTVECGEIGAEQQLTAAAIKQLIDAGAITPDPELEDYLRRFYRMPPREERAVS